MIMIVLIHIIGAIVAIIIHHKNGTLEYSFHHGDGIRSARPSDVIFHDIFLWEIHLLILIFDTIETQINEAFYHKFNSK